MKRFIDVSNRALGAVACLALFAMVVVGAVDVVGRYVFNNAITGAVEISKLLMAAVIAFTWAYTQTHRGHARVEFVVLRFPRRTRRVLTLMGDVVLLAFFALISWQLAVKGVDVWHDHRRILLLEIPLAYMYWVVSFNGFVTCLIIVLQLLAGGRIDAPTTTMEPDE